MLGAVEENILAYRFWTEMEFELVRVTETAPVWGENSKVSIMRRSQRDEIT